MEGGHHHKRSWSLYLLLLLGVAVVFGMASVALAAAPASYYIGSRKPQAKTVIVFVHGIFGDMSGTWLNEEVKPPVHWPTLLALDPDFQGVNVYAYQYDTKIGSPPSIQTIVSSQMPREFRDAGIFDHEKVIFVAHSLGGYVVRSFLINNPELILRVGFVFLFGSPTTGTSIANRLMLFLPENSQIRVLQDYTLSRDGEDYMAMIRTQWRRVSIPTHCAFEMEGFGLLGVVVSRNSATSQCNEEPQGIPYNHMRMVKPSGVSDHPHRALLDAYKLFLARDAKPAIPSVRNTEMPCRPGTKSIIFPSQEIRHNTRIESEVVCFPENTIIKVTEGAKLEVVADRLWIGGPVRFDGTGAAGKKGATPTAPPDFVMDNGGRGNGQGHDQPRCIREFSGYGNHPDDLGRAGERGSKGGNGADISIIYRAIDGSSANIVWSVDGGPGGVGGDGGLGRKMRCFSDATGSTRIPQEPRRGPMGPDGPKGDAGKFTLQLVGATPAARPPIARLSFKYDGVSKPPFCGNSDGSPPPRRAPRYNVDGLPNLALLVGTSAKASSEWPDTRGANHDTTYVIDGWYNNCRSWVAEKMPAEVVIDLGRDFEISSVAFASENDAFFRDRAATDFSIMMAPDETPEKYDEVYRHITGEPIASRKTFSFEPRRARYLKLEVRASRLGTVRIDELEIYGRE